MDSSRLVSFQLLDLDAGFPFAVLLVLVPIGAIVLLDALSSTPWQ